MWAFLLTLMILFEAQADILAKEWQLRPGVLRFTVAIIAYIITNIFWLFALQKGAGLTKGAIIFSVGSAILAILIGLVLYKEPITKMQVTGIFIGLLALVLLTWEG